MAHNTTLTQLKWFKWALWGPIATAVFFTAIIAIWDNSQQSLSWGLSSAHINDAIGRLKLPLAIASLAFPLVALVASHHRSVQTAAQIARTDQQIARTDKQMEVTEQKNAFENCIKHRELFNEFLNKTEPDYSFKVKDRDSLYKYLFPMNNYLSFSPKTSEFEVNDRKISLIKEAKINDLKSLLSSDDLEMINSHVIDISKTLFIGFDEECAEDFGNIKKCKILLLQCVKFLNDLSVFSLPGESHWMLRDEFFSEINEYVNPNSNAVP